MEPSMNIQQTASSSTTEAINNYFRSLPPGYRFYPSDDELVQYYLMRKHLKQELPINRIHDVKIYEHHPQDLAETYPRVRELDWFFFSQRERKYINGVRPNRSAEGGYWKATKRIEKVRTKSGEVIGMRMTLDFYEGKQPMGKLTKWKMHEYTLKDDEEVHRKNKRSITEGGSLKLNDYALCKIYIKKNGKIPDEINARTSNQLDVTSPDQEDQEVVELTNIATSHDQNPSAVQQIQEDQSVADLIPSHVHNYNCFSSPMINFDYRESLQNQAFFDGIQNQLGSSSSNNLCNQNYLNNNIYPMIKGNYKPWWSQSFAKDSGFHCAGSKSSKNLSNLPNYPNNDMNMMQRVHDQSFAFGSGFQVGSGSNNFCHQGYSDNNNIQTETSHDPSSSQSFGSGFPSTESCTGLEPANQEMAEVNPCSIALPEHVREYESNDMPVVPVRNQGNDVADGENNLDLSIDDYTFGDEVFSKGFLWDWKFI